MTFLHRLTILLAVAASRASAQCYYAANRLTNSDYIPCGDTSNGQLQSCCHLGDNCLADGVCFSLSTGMTYIAGCTDSSYTDATCGAQQCSKDTQVQGIAMSCRTGLWQCCTGTNQRGAEPEKTDPSSCQCDPNGDIAIAGPSAFALSAILPQSTNGQIALVNGAGSTTAEISVPATTIRSSSTSTSSSSSSSSKSTSSTTSSGSSQSTSSSTGATSSPSATSNTNPNSASGSSPTSSSSSSSSSSPSGSSSDSDSSPNLKLILGLAIPFSLIALAGIGAVAFLFWRRRRSDRNEFGPTGWDPFRHAPDDGRASRASAQWDNSYNNNVGAPATAVAGDDVAEAVRRNAEQHRQNQAYNRTGTNTDMGAGAGGDMGGLRPMSDLGGLASWKRDP